MNILLALSLITANGLDIDIWSDRNDSSYVPTENITLYFRTNEDCYVAVYDIEVGGREARLFPLGEPEAGNDGWVEAGKTYTLPSETNDYEYVIVGPAGIEKVIALASRERLPRFYDTGPDIVRETLEIYIREPEPATLIILSKPDKSRIFITDVETDETEYVGKTPHTIGLKPGAYIVEIKKTGFHTLSRRVWLDPGEQRRIFVELTPY